ncbi:MAG: heavy metal-responsive transcriptional regulator [Gammaproteobacteria bacterium]|nr:heavy metal-responsive transcriptional regulator [Gammaproteobacteria bacterium]
MDSRIYTIGSLGKHTGLTADTLRYYEKIGLLSDIPRSGGQRRYTSQHLEQLKFIRRAQAMDFTLAEIAQLLKLRVDPVGSRAEVRQLAEEKLHIINQRIKTLRNLHKELKGLVDECHHAGPGACPIIKGLEK